MNSQVELLRLQAGR